MNTDTPLQAIVIRKYEAEDFDKIRQLFVLNTPAYFAPNEEDDLIRYLTHEIQEYFILEVNGEIAGCGGINYSPDCSVGIISWDFFHPDYQGLGLGRALLHFRLEKLLATEGIQAISVRTSQFTYGFYEKSGFILKEIHKDFWAVGYDMYKMEYPVGRLS